MESDTKIVDPNEIKYSRILAMLMVAYGENAQNQKPVRCLRHEDWAEDDYFEEDNFSLLKVIVIRNVLNNSYTYVLPFTTLAIFFLMKNNY